MARGDDFAVFDDDCAEWSAVGVFYAGFCFGDSELHEVGIIHRDIITFYKMVFDLSVI